MAGRFASNNSHPAKIGRSLDAKFPDERRASVYVGRPRCGRRPYSLGVTRSRKVERQAARIEPRRIRGCRRRTRSYSHSLRQVGATETCNSAIWCHPAHAALTVSSRSACASKRKKLPGSHRARTRVGQRRARRPRRSKTCSGWVSAAMLVGLRPAEVAPLTTVVVELVFGRGSPRRRSQ